MAHHFGIIPTGKALGADVIDFDIKSMDQEDANRIRVAWLEHLVLRFRGLEFGDDEHVRFTKFLGDPELSPRALCTGEELVQNHPEIGVISNVLDSDGEPIGTLGDGECVWHTDMSYIEKLFDIGHIRVPHTFTIAQRADGFAVTVQNVANDAYFRMVLHQFFAGAECTRGKFRVAQELCETHVFIITELQPAKPENQMFQPCYADPVGVLLVH